MLQFSSIFPFIKPVDKLEISSNSGRYCNVPLGVYIDIPRGAVPESRLLRVEVGVCLYGPFEFPGNLYPITPILMLHPQHDVQLNKSVRITLPHVIESATDTDVKALGIKVIKGSPNCQLGESGQYVFDKTIEDSNLSFYTIGSKGFVTFLLSHFCFITVLASTKREVAERAMCCICPLFYPTSSMNFKYCLCVTYYMDPFLEVCINLC